jgi:Ser/Thr protein kinase RdoA (MazF antagonist)
VVVDASIGTGRLRHLARTNQDGRVDPLTAARDVAARLGLDAGDAVVLRELRTAVIHLRPSPVVARVAPASEEDVVRRQVAVTAHLAGGGAPVAAPWAEPGPYRAGDRVVTLWEHVDHDAERALDGFAAGVALRKVHEVLADFDPDGLPVFPRLDEVRRILATLDPEPAEARDLTEMLDRAEAAAARLDAPVQVVHADAWLGNVLRTPDGPLWTDFELTCVGPRELDLTCNDTSARDRGRTPEDEAFLVGYGEHDGGLRLRLAALELTLLTAWTYQLAATQPAYLEYARTRLGWALEKLRA